MTYLKLVLMLTSSVWLFSALPDAVADESLSVEQGTAQEIELLLNEFLAAASVGDVAIHERFWDEALVYTSSDGTRFGKKQLMQSLEESSPNENSLGISYWAEEISVRDLGELVILTFRLKSRSGNEEKDYLNSGLFVNRSGQWRATVWHATIASSDS